MSVVETVVVFALIPLGIYGVITLLTLWPKFTRGPRYRPGQEWEYEPVWWTANPAGLGVPAGGHGGAAGSSTPGAEPAEETLTAGQPAGTARGGARGSW
ncbi:aa3-type cytochrome oxidase subunit CtaJ [Streptoalloteichus hindustanus]|uniref:Uncharacterized protein n=1 Tax=Streptoalloteichus hindustanus TaxID=2017 RepID=A0A1M5NLM3_STRHI|nr:hypothetical protein [Streptoalloteichus hindustanus]SHG90450.1 hypothetical protein SAMN05444320_11635 [Streptoalloteichus hindustanus]